MNDSIYLNEIIRLFIGMVLLMAAYSKTLDIAQFKETLVSSFHLNKKLSNYLAPLLLIVEWAISVILLVKAPWLELAMLAALLMFIVFTTVVSFLLYRDGIVKCNCFGEEQRPASIFDMIRNTACILAILHYLFTPTIDSPLSLENGVLLFGVSLSLTFVMVNFHEIVSILRKSV